MAQQSSRDPHDRFTLRLEAFSDLVFGFSLSLLATRLDVPARLEDIFEPARWMGIVCTFALVCRFWLEHYRIFRHHFVAEMTDTVVNFIFLFSVAVLPYSLQTLLRFKLSFPSFALYAGDFALLLASLAFLRIRSLRQRRNGPDEADRLREWRRSVLQLEFALLLVGLVIALKLYGGTFSQRMSTLDNYFLIGMVLSLIVARKGVRRLPSFLRA